MEAIEVEQIVDDLCHVHHEDKLRITKLEQKYGCNISLEVEKVNVLQHTYFYELDFGKEENLFIEIESGINYGTQVNHSEWGVSTKSRTVIVDVLKNIVLDEEYYRGKGVLRAKAAAILQNNREKLFEFHRKNNYDNYVTGGNSKLQLDPLLAELKLKYIYEPLEVDRNFI